MYKKHLQELKQKEYVLGAYLFGSHKTSKQTPLSDIDICIFTKELTKNQLLDLKSYSTKKIDISIFDNLPIYIKPEVMKGKRLFAKDKRIIARKLAIAY